MEYIEFLLGILALVTSGYAHYRINKVIQKGNIVGGDMAGRDINRKVTQIAVGNDNYQKS